MSIIFGAGAWLACVLLAVCKPELGLFRIVLATGSFPGSSLEDVKRSLQNVLKDIDLRMKYHKSEIE